MPVTDFAHFRDVVAVLVLVLLEEALVLVNRLLLLLDPLLLLRQDPELVLLAFDLSIPLLVLLLELGNVLVARAHHLGIVIEEGGVLDQRCLQLLVLFAKLGLSRLELKLLLRVVLFLGDVRLLVFVHLPTLVQQAGRWRFRIKFL